MENLKECLEHITGLDREAMAAAKRRQDNLTKPLGSLGRLEEAACRIAGITRTVKPQVDKKRIVVFAADHGVSFNGVSAYPREVTAQMALNFIRGGAAINTLASEIGADLEVVDIGVDADLPENPHLLTKKIARGTADLSQGPAMTPETAEQALAVGRERAEIAHRDGVQLLGGGEMGIGNTTSASALYAALLGLDASAVTGRGTGLDDARLKHKVQVVEQSLAVNRARLTTPMDTLAALGGLEIAGLCGLILGAARYRIPIVIDGFIASAAALVAIRMQPAVKDFCLFSHLSEESGHRLLFGALDEQPLLNLNLRLGEGSGAALAMGIIQSAVAVHNRMATFADAGVSGSKDGDA